MLCKVKVSPSQLTAAICLHGEALRRRGPAASAVLSHNEWGFSPPTPLKRTPIPSCGPEPWHHCLTFATTSVAMVYFRHLHSRLLSTHEARSHQPPATSARPGCPAAALGTGDSQSARRGRRVPLRRRRSPPQRSAAAAAPPSPVRRRAQPAGACAVASRCGVTSGARRSLRRRACPRVPCAGLAPAHS